MQQLIRADSWLPLLPWCIQPVFRLNCVSVSSACQEETEPGGGLGNTVLAGLSFGLLLICPTSPMLLSYKENSWKHISSIERKVTCPACLITSTSHSINLGGKEAYYHVRSRILWETMSNFSSAGQIREGCVSLSADFLRHRFQHSDSMVIERVPKVRCLLI